MPKNPDSRAECPGCERSYCNPCRVARRAKLEADLVAEVARSPQDPPEIEYLAQMGRDMEAQRVALSALLSQANRTAEALEEDNAEACGGYARKALRLEVLRLQELLRAYVAAGGVIT